MFGGFGLKDMAIAALLVSVIGMGAAYKIKEASMNREINNLEEVLATAHTKIGRLTSEVASLEVQKANLTLAITTQNNAVQAFADAQLKATEDARAALAAALTVSKAWERRYSAVLSRPRPEGSECEAVATQLDNYLAIRLEEATAALGGVQ